MDPSPSLLDGAFWITSAAILLLLVLSGFFSGSETALTAASRGKLRAQADKGNRGADRALTITEDNERLIGSVLLGNNLVNILATSLATALFTRLFGESGVALATLIMTLLVLIFAEVLPKTFAITNAERAAAFVAAPIALVIRVFAPVVGAVRILVRGILSLFGVKTDPDSHILAVREEIAGALHLGHSEGVVEKEDRDRILGALDLSERTVEEIMLHRSGIEMIDADTPPREILTQCLESRHTRLPVFKNDPENIIGVIHAKDLLRAMNKLVDGSEDQTGVLEAFDITSIAMKPYFVPDTTVLEALLAAALRGGRVVLIFPRRNDSWFVAAASRSYYHRLLDAGCEIFEYCDGLLHAKTLTIDGCVSLIGSSNLDLRSFDLNYENNILLQDRAITRQIHARQQSYLPRSRPVTLDEVLLWPYLRRIWNNMAATIGPIL